MIVQKTKVWIKLTKINEISNPTKAQDDASKYLLLYFFKSFKFAEILQIIKNKINANPIVPCSYNKRA